MDKTNYFCCVAATVFLLLLPIACNAQSRMDVDKDVSLHVGAERLMAIINNPAESTVDFVQDLRNPNGGGVAVVSNQSSLVGTTHLVDTLLACNINVVKIFCPEHGFRGNAEAGATVASGKDPKTGLPIVSLYGKNKKPTPEQMKDLNFVIFDLQDVGCRFYTYISTLHYVMEACAERGIPCIVLDRPNPNGHYVDGPVLDPKYKSFIGMHPVPIVYGLTIGEYAKMINGEKWLKDSLQCDLMVVTMLNYHRDSSYALPVPPSPNLQTPHSILLYPSLCLFEGTNISVGRGTDYPFEIVGSPSFPITCVNTIIHIGDRKVAPICFKPHSIKGVSENPPFKDIICWGLDLRYEKVPAKFDLSWLLTMYSYCPQDFFKKSNSFEKLAGTDELRYQIEQGIPEETIRASWEPKLTIYKQKRKKYLLYPDVVQQ